MKSKKFYSDEDCLQIAVCDYLRYCAKSGVKWLHIPNEGRRSPAFGKKLKRMGVLKGAPDLLIFYDNQVYFIELKAGGHLTKEQREFRAWAENYNYNYFLGKSFESIEKKLIEWGVINA